MKKKDGLAKVFVKIVRINRRLVMRILRANVLVEEELI